MEKVHYIPALWWGEIPALKPVSETCDREYIKVQTDSSLGERKSEKLFLIFGLNRKCTLTSNPMVKEEPRKTNFWKFKTGCKLDLVKFRVQLAKC